MRLESQVSTQLLRVKLVKAWGPTLTSMHVTLDRQMKEHWGYGLWRTGQVGV